MANYVDQGSHPAGQHALWEELCRVRRLLRDGGRLVDQLECLAAAEYPALYAEAKAWQERVRKAGD